MTYFTINIPTSYWLTFCCCLRRRALFSVYAHSWHSDMQLVSVCLSASSPKTYNKQQTQNSTPWRSPENNQTIRTRIMSSWFLSLSLSPCCWNYAGCSLNSKQAINVFRRPQGYPRDKLTECKTLLSFNQSVFVSFRSQCSGVELSWMTTEI